MKTRMHSSRMRTARISSCLRGMSASVHAGIHPLGVGLETSCQGVGLETPPGVGLETPQVWTWRPPQARPLNFPRVWARRPLQSDPSSSSLETCKAYWDTTSWKPARHAGIPLPHCEQNHRHV